MKHIYKIKILVLCTAISFNCLANPGIKMLNQIEEKYKDGYCDSILKNPLYNSDVLRYMTLIAMEDITMFSIGNDAITGRWIGNLNTFKIGRKLNPIFVDFIEYADRSDVKSIVSQDSEEFSKAANTEIKLKKASFENLKKELKKIEDSSLMPMATRTKAEAKNDTDQLSFLPITCKVFQIVMDENSATAIEFRDYAESVRKRATHRNIEKFQQSLKDLESIN